MQSPAVVARAEDHEELRLRTLYSYHILDTVEEQAFDDICQLAASVCRTPRALISLVDRRRQWFKARFNFEPRETEIECSFCVHAIQQGDTLVVEDAVRDDRFVSNRLVLSNPGVRFYAGVPIRAANGYELGALCVIDPRPRTLTKSQRSGLTALARQVEAQLELRRAQFEKDAMGRFIVHDLRNPLTSMLANAEFLLEQSREGRADEESLGDLVEAARLFQRRIEDFHSLLGSEYGTLPVRLEEVDLRALTEALRVALKGPLTVRNVRLQTKLAETTVRGDYDLLRRMLENLLYNALLVSPSGSTVTIESGTSGTSTFVRVLDEGPGIDDEMRAELFGLKRMQVRAGRVSSGLGLAFCAAASRALGGDILCEPRAPGAGAAFRISIASAVPATGVPAAER